MARSDGFAIPGRITVIEHGYDGEGHYPERRVSVCPDAIWRRTYQIDLQAKGLLLDVFCRYWSMAEAPVAEDIRKSNWPRLSRRKFDELVSSLVRMNLLATEEDRLIPLGPFSQDPDERAGTPRQSRDMPADWIERRRAVFERDGFACVYCGSGRDLHCDHVHPVALGGGHDEDNLVTACASCNLKKGSKTVAEWRPDVAARFAK